MITSEHEQQTKGEKNFKEIHGGGIMIDRDDIDYHDQRMKSEIAKENFYLKLSRPFYLMMPKIFKDGNQWCTLYGENLQVGIAGFGNSPEEATEAFDKEWCKKEKIGGCVATKKEVEEEIKVG